VALKLGFLIPGNRERLLALHTCLTVAKVYPGITSVSLVFFLRFLNDRLPQTRQAGLGTLLAVTTSSFAAA
jgi:hypothetical protein